MQRITLEELYLHLLDQKPDDVEFWDPTCDALILYDEIQKIPGR